MRYYDGIGFETTVEDPIGSGIWVPTVTEKNYYGDVTRNSRRIQSSEFVSTNDDVSISNQVSIMADEFALSNFHSIRYARFMGTCWKVTDVEFQGPRLLLTLGGVYNGKQAGTADTT